MSDDIIYSYTTKDAVEDGYFTDTKDLASEVDTGTTLPVYLSAGIVELINRAAELGASIPSAVYDLCYVTKYLISAKQLSRTLMIGDVYTTKLMIGKHTEEICVCVQPYEMSSLDLCITLFRPDER